MDAEAPCPHPSLGFGPVLTVGFGSSYPDHVVGCYLEQARRDVVGEESEGTHRI